MPHQCTGCGHAFEDGSKEMLSGCPECGGNTFQFRPEGATLPDDPDPPGEAPDAPEPPAPEERSAVADSGSVAETVGRATTKVRDFVSTNPTPAGSDTTGAPDPDRSWPSETEAGETDVAAGGTGWPDEPDGAGRPADSSRRNPPSDPDSRTESDGEIIDADARQDAEPRDEEDVAQASARTDVVTNDELDDVEPPADPRQGPGDGDRTAAASSATDPHADADEGGPGALGGSSKPDVDGDAEVVGQPSDENPDLAELREQLNDQFESIKILEPGQYELNLMELYDREEYIIALQENGRYVIQVPDQWIGDDLDDR